MKVTDEIAQRMKKHPGAKCEISGSVATVFPTSKNGFKVSLVEGSASHFTVSFDNWHEEYDAAEDALNVFAFGLSKACRLRVDYRGSLAHEWTVEEKCATGNWTPCHWIGLSTTGMICPFFWLKKSIVYLQNDVLEIGD